MSKCKRDILLIFGYLLIVAIVLPPFILIIHTNIFAQTEDICNLIKNAKVVADDGKYLGKITNKYDSESILNKYGTYGSKYNSESIWNKYGEYGSRYSLLSPFNKYSTTPPLIIKNNDIIGRLTINKNINNAISPYILFSCEFVPENFDNELLKKLKQKLENLEKSNNSLRSKNYNGSSEGHWIAENIDGGRFIKLEDGSLWEISPLDIVNTCIWLVVSDIAIVESNDPNYPYILINTDDVEKASAKLIRK